MTCRSSASAAIVPRRADIMCSLPGRGKSLSPPCIVSCMDASARDLAEEKELLLREDRRLLGRLLGDVISEQVGPETRERIETIRQTAVRFRRSLSDPALAGEAQGVKAELEAQLDALPIEETLHVVRAFSYFSLLLNIAEDAHQNRRRQAHAE